ncbi:MAG: hypothetical protein DRP78_01710 [Candidatus Omnitrophota bacterium]|nr:MAG: hypothetical protein DRP78_01710 [Candidatus Omnitrophota bacterium]
MPLDSSGLNRIIEKTEIVQGTSAVSRDKKSLKEKKKKQKKNQHKNADLEINKNLPVIELYDQKERKKNIGGSTRHKIDFTA